MYTVGTYYKYLCIIGFRIQKSDQNQNITKTKLSAHSQTFYKFALKLNSHFIIFFSLQRAVRGNKKKRLQAKADMRVM